LGSEGGRFARTLEALATRRRPGQSVALAVGDGDDGVVERGVHVGNAVRNVLADLLADTGGGAGLLLSHGNPSNPFISSATGQPWAGPGACAHWPWCAGHAPASRGDGESRGSSRCPSGA